MNTDRKAKNISLGHIISRECKPPITLDWLAFQPNLKAAWQPYRGAKELGERERPAHGTKKHMPATQASLVKVYQFCPSR